MNKNPVQQNLNNNGLVNRVPNVNTIRMQQPRVTAQPQTINPINNINRNLNSSNVVNQNLANIGSNVAIATTSTISILGFSKKPIELLWVEKPPVAIVVIA